MMSVFETRAAQPLSARTAAQAIARVVGMTGKLYYIMAL